MLDPQIIFFENPKNYLQSYNFCQEIYKNVEIDVESFPVGYTVNELEFFLTTYTDWAFFSKSSHNINIMTFYQNKDDGQKILFQRNVL